LGICDDDRRTQYLVGYMNQEISSIEEIQVCLQLKTIVDQLQENLELSSVSKVLIHQYTKGGVLNFDFEYF
jgi:hypothetical protein